MEKNREKHKKENRRDFKAYKLMKDADKMRKDGKSQKEINKEILNRLNSILKREKNEPTPKNKYEIIPYDGKVAKASRGEMDIEI